MCKKTVVCFPTKALLHPRHLNWYMMSAFWFIGILSFEEQNIDIFLASYKILNLTSFKHRLLFLTQYFKYCSPLAFSLKYGTRIQIVFLSSAPGVPKKSQTFDFMQIETTVFTRSAFIFSESLYYFKHK